MDEGHCGIVVDIDASDAQFHRLQAMGIARGRRVMLVRRGNPIIVAVLGTRIGLARSLADAIAVAPADALPCERSPAGDASTSA